MKMKRIPTLLRQLQNGSIRQNPTAYCVRNHSTSPSSSPSSSSVSSAELKHFASLASSWWDPMGSSRILHLMNPLRHDFIASCLEESQQAASRNSKEGGDINTSSSSIKNRGLEYLDIGCGGGIFAESLARTIPLHDNTAMMTPISSSSPTQTNASSLLAIDPSPVMIDIALSHARKDPALYTHLQSGKFQYKNTSLEALADSDSEPNSSSIASPQPTSTSTSTPTHPQFDMITLFEVIEHIDPSTSSPLQFLKQCLSLLRPGGWLIGSTIARTYPSYVINQLIAEAPWPIGVVPRGTHQWSKFVNPDELRRWAERAVVKPGVDGGLEYPRIQWKCVGAMYAPGVGWKMVPGAESWGNYFWAVRKL